LTAGGGNYMIAYNAYNHYKESSVNTASSEELTLMLYNGLVKFLMRSIDSIEKKNISEAHNNIMRSQDIISEFMNTEGESELTEGIQYLTGYNNAYKPALKSSKGDYTFQFICEALKSFNFNSYIDEIIRIIIFDSLIGNGDRHQENWGIIIYSKEAIQTYHKEAKNKKYKYFHRLLLKMFGWIFENLPSLPNPLKIMFHSLMPNKFAPIYDSGSCLGRELRDAKVKQMLSDEKQILSYILKGTSEIHWKGKKVSHFELIKKISEKHPEIVKTEIQRIKSIYNESNISKIITDVDIKLPQDKGEFKLPEERKKLMIKMVSLRFKELSKLLD
jgi:flagellar biosynthetic protein FliS